MKDQIEPIAVNTISLVDFLKPKASSIPNLEILPFISKFINAHEKALIFILNDYLRENQVSSFTPASQITLLTELVKSTQLIALQKMVFMETYHVNNELICEFIPLRDYLFSLPNFNKLDPLGKQEEDTFNFHNQVASFALDRIFKMVIHGKDDYECINTKLINTLYFSQYKIEHDLKFSKDLLCQRAIDLNRAFLIMINYLASTNQIEIPTTPSKILLFLEQNLDIEQISEIALNHDGKFGSEFHDVLIGLKAYVLSSPYSYPQSDIKNLLNDDDPYLDKALQFHQEVVKYILKNASEYLDENNKTLS